MYDIGITLNGFYAADPDILEGVNLPEGLDNKILTDLIIERCGGMYPFIQADTYLKRQIHNWFDSNFHNFERILLAINADYSPIENYDRHEDITRKELETAASTSQANGTGENTGLRAADNSENFRNVDKGISSASDTAVMNGSNNRDYVETLHAHGNIGTTKNSEMVLDEIEVRNYNIYEDIASRFEDKFMICVY